MSEEVGVGLEMAGRARLKKCCCCLSLDQGSRAVGAVFLLFTLGKWFKYMQVVEQKLKIYLILVSNGFVK